MIKIRWRKTHINDDDDFKVFAQVTTVREVMKLYDIKNCYSVYALIYRGDILAQQIEGTWILSTDSVIAWFGEPKLNNIA